MQTLDTLGIIPPVSAAEATTIRANLHRLARDEADTELLCAAIMGQP